MVQVLRLHSFPGTLEMAQIIIGPAPRRTSLRMTCDMYFDDMKRAAG